MNDPTAKTTAEWPGIEEATGFLNFRIGAWHDFGYVIPPSPDCKTIPPLGERSAEAIKAGHGAIELIDEIVRELYRVREQLAGELRADEDIREALAARPVGQPVPASTFTCCATALPWPTKTEDRTCPECGTTWEREPVDIGAGARIKATPSDAECDRLHAMVMEDPAEDGGLTDGCAAPGTAQPEDIPAVAQPYLADGSPNPYQTHSAVPAAPPTSRAAQRAELGEVRQKREAWEQTARACVCPPGLCTRGEFRDHAGESEGCMVCADLDPGQPCYAAVVRGLRKREEAGR